MGSPTRLSAIMSSKVKGCLLCAQAGRTNDATRIKPKKRRMTCLRGERASVNHAGFERS